MADPTGDPFVLRAASGQAALRPSPYGPTNVWSYNGSVPGPEIRVRQGDRLLVLAQNGLDEGTTIHWHGIRTPNAIVNGGAILGHGSDGIVLSRAA
ncbi:MULTISPECIES: multicopper oxidase domain-containing protein [unclassified Sulfitobacter]|uniref:multicopper oxidase domain-containing protein n=1 Tax=Sulfitobacter TaxID=60136 RepID=UPI0020C79C4E|nr:MULTISPECIES: multicopper oxidase domain-containing protein [unclassified Sulfitobacter]